MVDIISIRQKQNIGFSIMCKLTTFFVSGEIILGYSVFIMKAL